MPYCGHDSAAQPTAIVELERGTCPASEQSRLESTAKVGDSDCGAGIEANSRRFAVTALQLGDLIESSQVPPTLERGAQPDFHQAVGQLLAHYVTG